MDNGVVEVAVAYQTIPLPLLIAWRLATVGDCKSQKDWLGAKIVGHWEYTNCTLVKKNKHKNWSNILFLKRVIILISH